MMLIEWKQSKYTCETLALGIQCLDTWYGCCITGTMEVNWAVLEYGTLPMTLKDWVTGRVVYDTEMGANHYVTSKN